MIFNYFLLASINVCKLMDANNQRKVNTVAVANRYHIISFSSPYNTITNDNATAMTLLPNLPAIRLITFLPKYRDSQSNETYNISLAAPRREYSMVLMAKKEALAPARPVVRQVAKVQDVQHSISVGMKSHIRCASQCRSRMGMAKNCRKPLTPLIHLHASSCCCCSRREQ